MKTKITEKDFEFKITSKNQCQYEVLDDIPEFDFSKVKKPVVIEDNTFDLIAFVLGFIVLYFIYSHFNFSFNFLNFEHLFTFRNYL